MTDHNAIYRAVVETALDMLPTVTQGDARIMADEVLRRLAAEARKPTARDRLDAAIATVDALGIQSCNIKTVDMVDRIDHLVTIGVHSVSALAILANQLDMPLPWRRQEGGYEWSESVLRPDRGTWITIQAHRPGRYSAA